MAKYRLLIPGGLEPAAWIAKQTASPPMIIPEWPVSSRKALVVVIRDGIDRPNTAETEAFVVTTAREMDDIVSDIPNPQLWFSVSRSALMVASVCPELRDEDFED